MNADPDECLVHCRDCNGYLHAISRHEPKTKGQGSILVDCPYECDSDDEPGDGPRVALREQPYGRS